MSSVSHEERLSIDRFLCDALKKRPHESLLTRAQKIYRGGIFVDAKKWVIARVLVKGMHDPDPWRIMRRAAEKGGWSP